MSARSQSYEKTGALVKSSASSLLTSIVTSSVTDDMLCEVLQDLVEPPGKAEGLLTTEEVSALIHKGYRHTRRFINSEQPLTAAMFVRLAQESFLRGDQRLLSFIVPPGYTLVPLKEAATNGNVDDEIGDLTEAQGRMRECFNRGDMRGAKKWQAKAKEIQQRIDLEIERKGGK